MTASEPGALHGPLHDHHVAAGATMVPFAGWLMPLRFGSDLGEHNTVRSAAGLFDLSHMGEITLEGPESGLALNIALVGQLEALAIGRARYTMMCADDGGVLDDLIVYRTGEQEYLVVANASNSDAVFAALQERGRGLDVAINDVTSAHALLAVQGPNAVAIVNSLVAEAEKSKVIEQGYYSIIDVTMDGSPVSLARTGYTGEDGFEILSSAADGPKLWSALLEAGKDHGLLPAGLAARDTLRLEAGMPLYGHELSQELTPFDAGLGRVVRFDKPEDFVGRAALERAAKLKPARAMVGLVGQGKRPARATNLVVDESGKAIGELTSGGPSPTLKVPIAIAYIDNAYADAGRIVNVDIRGRTEPFQVVTLPFYRRPKA